MNRLLNWLDDRTGYQELLHEALYERIPGGARWRYVWGSSLVFTFTVQVITGVFLWTAYSPSAQTAWESVYYIQNEMTLGWLVRGLHHFSAQAMVVLLALHLIQVIIDGAYRAPREVNFWLGLILLQIVLGLSLTGYLLPWDQKGYYATKVATKIMGSTPLIGPSLQQLVQGGTEYGHHTLTRFFAMHAGILPGLLIVFLALHLHVFRRHGVTPKEPLRGPDTFFWPEQVFKDSVICLLILMVVMTLAIYEHGAPLSAPANPAEPYSAARPEWYFLFLFQFLRFEWVEHVTNGPAFGAIYVPGAVMLLMILMPLIGRSEKGHRFNIFFTWFLMLGVGVLTAWAFITDAKDESFQQAVAEAERDALRVKELAAGPAKIPVEGAITLLKNDPFTQGPKLFAKHCASCHRYNGHDGTGRLVYETIEVDRKKKQVAAYPTAADLGTFGSPDWFRSLLLKYPEHFGGFRHTEWFRLRTVQVAALQQEWDKLSAEEAEKIPAEKLQNLSRRIISLGEQIRRENLDRKIATLKARRQQLLREGVAVIESQKRLRPQLDPDSSAEDRAVEESLKKKLADYDRQLAEVDKEIKAADEEIKTTPPLFQTAADTAEAVQQQLKQLHEWAEENLLHPQQSEMAMWWMEDPEDEESRKANTAALFSEKSKKDVEALIAFLVSLGDRRDLKPDKTLVKKGRDIFESGEFAGGTINACTNCHNFSDRPKFHPSSEEFSYPDLTRLYSTEWLSDFLKFPMRSQFYGEKNQMPGFASRLSEKELRLLVRWLLRDYAPTEIEPLPSRKEELQELLKQRPDYQPPAEKTGKTPASPH